MHLKIFAHKHTFKTGVSHNGSQNSPGQMIAGGHALEDRRPELGVQAET